VGTLKLLPPQYRLLSLRQDYKSMQDMIFDKQLEFDEIVTILEQLEESINKEVEE